MARNAHKASPYSTQPRRGTYDAERWDVQRGIVLLSTQLEAERGALETWKARLARRLVHEKSHAEASQLPVLRQVTAACHARVLDLERRLLDTRHLLRVLRARQDAR